MSLRRLIVAVAAGLALLVPATASGATLLRGTVGPYRTIQLLDAQGANTVKVKAGLFTFRIEDKSNTLSFCLKGPGMNRVLTGVKFTGVKRVSVRLRKGVYTYYDRTQSKAMRGTFRVV